MGSLSGVEEKTIRAVSEQTKVGMLWFFSV